MKPLVGTNPAYRAAPSPQPVRPPQPKVQAPRPAPPPVPAQPVQMAPPRPPVQRMRPSPPPPQRPPPAAVPTAQPGVAADRRTVPFDYAFNFTLTGEVGKVHRQVVTVSIEAEFVAASVGYGVFPTVEPIVFGADIQGGSLWSISFSDIRNTFDAQIKNNPLAVVSLLDVLRNGFRLNPLYAETLLTVTDTLDPRIAEQAFESIGAPPEQIQFRYALFDDASGREFQSAPLLNTAGLGASTGERPFRRFATPIRFAPRSAIRMEITEVSEFRGDLQVVLQGYKELGGAGSPTSQAGRARRDKRR